ncbi:MAG: DUF4129 domain-containing protein [Clostridia bacterium]|nr:DUF4129 domain-containing protein [Clostridia bacterium]
MQQDKDKFQHSLMFLFTEQLLIFPISFTLLKLFQIELTTFVYGFLFLLAYGFIYLRTDFVRIKRQHAVIGTLCVILVVGFLLCSFSLKLLPVWGLSLFVMIRALRVLEHPYSGFSFYSFVAVGIIAYVTTALFLKNLSTFSPYMGFMGICATIAVIMSVLCMNMTIIGYERTIGNRRTRIPSLSKSSNRILLTVFSLLILFFSSLGFIDAIWSAIMRFFSRINTALASLFHWVNGLITITPSNLPPPEESPGNTAEIIEPSYSSPFMQQLESITKTAIVVILVLVLLALIFLLARYLVRNYKRICRTVRNKLQRAIGSFLRGHGHTDETDCGYEDEITSLLRNETLLQATSRWFRSRSRNEQSYIFLKDNKERARWWYTRLLRKEIKRGQPIQKAMSPSEALKTISKSRYSPSLNEQLNAAVTTYEKARYSELAPSEQELEALKRFYSSKSSSV